MFLFFPLIPFFIFLKRNSERRGGGVGAQEGKGRTEGEENIVGKASTPLYRHGHLIPEENERDRGLNLLFLLCRC